MLVTSLEVVDDIKENICSRYLKYVTNMFRFHQMSLTLISGMQQITSPEQLKQTMISASKAENKYPKMIANINDPGIQKVFKNIIQSDNKVHILNGFMTAR